MGRTLSAAQQKDAFAIVCEQSSFLNIPNWREQGRHLSDRCSCDVQMCEMVILALPDTAQTARKYTPSAAFSTISPESST